MDLSEQSHVYLFVNESSGGGVGRKLLKMETPLITFNLVVYSDEPPLQIHAHIFDMRQHRHVGIQQILQKTSQGERVIAVACGGDGTVMWLVEQLAANRVNFDLCPIAVIPLGTGNDFSQHFGWGKTQTTLVQNSCQSLKRLLKEWHKAKQENFDLWDLELILSPKGSIYLPKDSSQTLLETRVLRKTFCNYFSFGIDAQIGYQFSLNRTNSRTGNLAMYGLFGVTQGIRTAHTLGKVIDHIKQADMLILQSPQQNSSFFGEMMNSIVRKVTKDLWENQNLLLLNINSYMGGVKGLWDNSAESSANNYEPTKSSSGDGKVEIISFATNLEIGLQKALSTFGKKFSLAKKVFQGKGPLTFVFRELAHQDDHIFVQVDGEFYKVYQPLEASVRRSKLVPNGTIKVLQRAGQIPNENFNAIDANI